MNAATMRRHRLVTAAGSVKADRDEVHREAERLVAEGFPARVECSQVTLMPSGVEILDRFEQCACELPSAPGPLVRRFNDRCDNCDHRRGDHGLSDGKCAWRTRDTQDAQTLCLCVAFLKVNGE
ncbi:MAG: hypothetical protein ABW067_17390 [Rhizobacter sp.]